MMKIFLRSILNFPMTRNLSVTASVKKDNKDSSNSSSSSRKSHFYGSKPMTTPSVEKATFRPPEKIRFTYHANYGRNFITPQRAIDEFMLKPEHLTDLKATNRRSPNDDNPNPVRVYSLKGLTYISPLDNSL